MSLDVKIYFDGACDNKLDNPPMGIGVSVEINGNHDPFLSCWIPVEGRKGNSSNVAEWYGCVKAMQILSILDIEDRVEIFSDSKVIASQFNGDYAIRQEKFIPYFKKAKDYALIAGRPNIKVNWIERKYNKHADKLSKKGTEKFKKSLDKK